MEHQVVSRIQQDRRKRSPLSGYGAPKENFDHCPEAVLILPLQVVCGQMLDACVIGVVFAQKLG